MGREGGGESEGASDDTVIQRLDNSETMWRGGEKTGGEGRKGGGGENMCERGESSSSWGEQMSELRAY